MLVYHNYLTMSIENKKTTQNEAHLTNHPADDSCNKSYNIGLYCHQ